MLTFEAAVQAAIIAGFVSVLVTWLNNHFQRQSKEEEHKRKRREWFLEKQSRDVEEIIITLDAHLKRLGMQLGETERILYRAELVADPEMITFEEETGELLAQAAKLFNEIADDSAAQPTWFEYDSLRLTIWFDNAEHLRLKLAEIGKQTGNIYHDLHTVAFRMYGAFENFEKEKEQSLQIFNEAFELGRSNRKTWEKLVSDMETIQRELIDSLREG